MLSFREVLAQKVQVLSREVHDIPAEMPTRETELSPELLRGLLTFKLESPRKTGEIPSTAQLYRSKFQQNETMRRKTFALAWEKVSPQHYKYYGVFAALGEWDFSPSDKTALKKRFRKLLRKTHPDVNHSKSAHADTQKLLEAFEFLKN